MSDIELVIKMPEAEYDECIMQVKMIEQEGIYYESSNYTLKKYIANGIPLPKGHGVLKDVTNIMRGLYTDIQTTEETFTSSDVYKMIDEECPTIIEGSDSE